MKQLLSLAVLALLCLAGNAQEYKVSMSNGKILLHNVNNVTIEGYSGSEVLITKMKGDPECEDKDEDDEEEKDRRKGLREINAAGKSDNTGIGLNTNKEGSKLHVEQISKNNSSPYRVQVPAGVAIFYEHSNHSGDEITIKNISSEIEIDANYNDISFKNLSGPVALNTVYGDIEGSFEKVSSKSDVSIYSVYGHVDVTIPASTKADFRLNAPYGQMFTDLDLDVSSKTNTGHSKGSRITGSLNGGGIDFSIKASYDNIYLRKKKS